jgi:hypothetical protein
VTVTSSWAVCRPRFCNRGQHGGSIRVGGLPNPDLQCLALQLLDIQIDSLIEYDFSLTFAWVPRDQNVRKDYLSHVSEAPSPPLTTTVGGRGGSFTSTGCGAPHSVDRFATADNRQPL